MPITKLYEYSVIYSDRSYNLMSDQFISSMKFISNTLKKLYNFDFLALIPGSGTYAMESVARQFAMNKKVLVVRNGYFSYRWSDIFNVCKIPNEEIVLKATKINNDKLPTFEPLPIGDIVLKIITNKPQVVFAPHVETSTGIMLPNEYLKSISSAAHQVGAIFVLDCIASGNIWLDMKDLGIDVIISAPQKGFSGPAGFGLVFLNKKSRDLINLSNHNELSFCCNLKKWLEVMEEYDKGKFKYYTTLPTNSIMEWYNILKEANNYGFDKLKKNCKFLGIRITNILLSKGFKRVTSLNFHSPSVIVCYTEKSDMVKKFKDNRLQIAGGVPFMLDEESILDARKYTFRIGLFGLDKIKDIHSVAVHFEKTLNKLLENE
jgi:aspartate aminotransferase-like enzyme